MKGRTFILGPSGWRRMQHLPLVCRLMGVRRFAEYLRGLLWEQRVYLRLERSIHNSASVCPAGLPAAAEGFRWVRGDLTELRRLRDQKHLRSLLPLECWTDLRAGLHWFQSLWRGEEELVHIHWVALPGQKTSLPRLEVGSGEAEIRAAFTAPAFRSRGFFALALHKTLADLAHGPVHRVFAYVRPANQASLRAFQKAGFQVAGLQIVKMRLGFCRTELRAPSHT